MFDQLTWHGVVGREKGRRGRQVQLEGDRSNALTLTMDHFWGAAPDCHPCRPVMRGHPRTLPPIQPLPPYLPQPSSQSVGGDW